MPRASYDRATAGFTLVDRLAGSCSHGWGSGGSPDLFDLFEKYFEAIAYSYRLSCKDGE